MWLVLWFSCSNVSSCLCHPVLEQLYRCEKVLSHSVSGVSTGTCRCSLQLWGKLPKTHVPGQQPWGLHRTIALYWSKLQLSKSFLRYPTSLFNFWTSLVSHLQWWQFLDPVMGVEVGEQGPRELDSDQLQISDHQNNAQFFKGDLLFSYYVGCILSTLISLSFNCNKMRADILIHLWRLGL